VAPPPMRMTSRSLPQSDDANVEEVAAEDNSARAGGPLVREQAVVGVVGKRPRVRRLAGAQTVVRAGVGPGDEAVEGDRDVSDDSSHARADPIRRPNSSLTHERVADANSIARRARRHVGRTADDRPEYLRGAYARPAPIRCARHRAFNCPSALNSGG
jgi:hypothetical protein